MRYFLGIDGGATKTEGVIIDENEKVLAQALARPVNYHQDGEQETAQNLEETIKKVLSKVSLNLKDINFAVFGLAGRDTKEDEIVLERLAQNLFDGRIKKRIKVVSDVEIAFAACISKNYGAVLISGTGANCFARGKNGKSAWAGDWGWLLGDQASGFALAQAALQAVMEDFDGRGEKTVLTKLILNRLSLSQADQLVDWVYQKEIPVKEIAALAPLIFAAYKKEDKVAKKLVSELVSEMALDLKTIARETDLTYKEFEIGLVGGLFKEKLAIELLEKETEKILLKAKLVLPKMKPALAAAILAKGEVNLA